MHQKFRGTFAPPTLVNPTTNSRTAQQPILVRTRLYGDTVKKANDIDNSLFVRTQTSILCTRWFVFCSYSVGFFSQQADQVLINTKTQIDH